MTALNQSQAKIIDFPPPRKQKDQPRKSGLNRNKERSVRKVNGKAYVDFMYLNERVREPSGLAWNRENARKVREQLDKIIVAIKSGDFRFADVFPTSKKRDYFQEKENALFNLGKTPDQVLFKDYVWTWYNLLKDSGRVAERTLWGYKSYINIYLVPFFGELTFGALNKITFDEFVSWARKQQYKKKSISNETVNKIFVPMKIICKDAAIKYGWGSIYNPFFGFKRLSPDSDSYEKIFPFSLEEQAVLVAHLPDHWKPYFLFAFRSGLRQGEQIGLKPGDIDWGKKLVHVRRAITLNEAGKVIEGRTKNRYSRRTIRLIPAMLEALEAQKKIYEKFQGEYFFCSETGARINPSNLRNRAWIPALKKTDLKSREMKQTRHTFATIALSIGENPLWIAKVMGHRNADMIIKVYGKYVENADGSKDGVLLDSIYQGTKGNDE